MSSTLHRAIERIFAPLSRLLISKGISYGYAAEMLKKAILREADIIVRKGDGRISDSRLSIATGLHRKDVKRLKEEIIHDRPSAEISITSQVIAKWLAEPKSRGSKIPARLRHKKINPDETDFDDLVAAISKDVRPKVVLDELIHRGVVTISEDQLLSIHPEKLTLNQDEVSLANYLGMNVSDHLSVAVDNLINHSDPQLERCVHYHGLSRQAAEKLAELAQSKAMEALLAVNEEAQRLIKDQANRGNQRINFGMYFYKQDNTENPANTANS